MVDLPVEDLAGSSFDIGRQHGEGRREQVHAHLELALARGGADRVALRERALAYRPFVTERAPWLDAEIAGVAVGANLRIGDAYLLQLRAELDATDAIHGAGGGECTTFATRTNGQPLAGQNVDLPEAYGPLLSVRRVDDGERPPLLMLAAAGLVSHVGLNGAGLAVFASFLACGGWRLGFPRYLLARLALAERDVPSAAAVLAGTHRAASRAMLLADASGAASVLELTPTRSAELPAADLTVHANHFEAEALLDEEAAPADWLEDSHARADRLRELLGAQVEPEHALRDRTTLPFPLSRQRGDGDDDFVTVASVIAHPAARRLRIAAGPPHLSPYVTHEVPS